MRGRYLWLAVLALLAAVAFHGSAPAGAAAAIATVDGTIQSVASALVVIMTKMGQTKVTTTTDTRVIGRSPARMSEIKVDDFVGVDSKRTANGSLSAVEVHIFPPALKAPSRERQFLMDSGDTMTNAVVTQQVTRVSGRTLTLSYPGGTTTVIVPPSAAIHRLTVVTLAALKPGMHATARGPANPDGNVIATTIVVDQASR